MGKWTRRPQEVGGNYFFGGKCYCTMGIKNELSEEEILFIVDSVKAFVKESNGIDYLQVFDSDEHQVVFVIDNITKDMLDENENSEEEKLEQNYFTVLFSSEY